MACVGSNGCSRPTRTGVSPRCTRSPLVGGRLENLGYDRDYTLRPHDEAVDVPVWDDIMRWDGTRLTTTAPVLVDVGAAGKGYLVDLVAGVLNDAGI
ncbi:MAG TPA: hypothetical protein VHU90_03175, partial [Galbitalea sp.]|nr:hypothetical protein [Galbitalea sp.]